MSALASTRVPIPTDEQAFERACVPLWVHLLGDPAVQQVGRRGQKQSGADLVGMRDRDPNRWVGIQCKLKGPGKQLTEAEVRREVKEALGFAPALSEFFVVTTAPDDRRIQELAQIITREIHDSGGSMIVHVWGWNTLEQKITESTRAREAFDPTFTPYAETIRQEVAEHRSEDDAGHATSHAMLAKVLQALGVAQPSQIFGSLDDTATRAVVDGHLDAEIDTYRDLANQGQARAAQQALERLLARVRDSASGRILFRITANLAFCRWVFGDEVGAARLFEDAYACAPDEPKAVANRMLGFLLREQWPEGLAFGRQRLGDDPSNVALAGYVLQAARHDTTVEHPLQLVPKGLRGAAPVMAAWADILRDREDPEAWRGVARSALEAHPDDEHIRLLAATAEFDEILTGPSFQRTHRLTAEERARVVPVAEEFRRRWEAARSADTPLRPEHRALGANLSLALVALGDRGEALTVLKQGLEAAPDDNDLVARTVMVALDVGDRAEVERLLPQLPNTPEAILLRLQWYLAREAWAEILELLRSHGEMVPEPEQPLAKSAEALADLATRSEPVSEASLEPIAREAEADARASVLVAEFAQERDLEAMSEAAFRAAIRALENDDHVASRTTVALYAERRGESRVVADLLLDHVDESHDSRELRALARALVNDTLVRDRAVRFFERLPESLRDKPEYLYGAGILHHNRGALPEAEQLLRRALERSPQRLDRRLTLIRTLRRMGREGEVGPLLSDLDLATVDGTPGEKMEVAQLLRSVGRGTDGLRFGYETLRAAPNDPQAVLGYMGLVLLLPEGDDALPVADTVGQDCWVALEGEDGHRHNFVVEGNEDRPAQGVVSPRHTLIAAAMGRRAGESFEVAASFGNVRSWRVVEVKHKYLHALHETLSTFEVRFPDVGGFHTLQVRDEDPGPVFEQIKHTAESHTALANLYTEHQVPLGFVAAWLGRDVVGFAEFVRSLGRTIRSCTGLEVERIGANTLIEQRRAGGAVLDTYTAWVAATADALDILRSVFGSIQVARSTIDDFLILRDRIQAPVAGAPLLTVGWRNEQFIREEVSAEVLEERRSFISAQIQKIEAECEVVAVSTPDEVSEHAVALTDMFGANALDPAYLAGGGRLLVSEDQSYRDIAEQVVGCRGVWLDAVFRHARIAGLVNQARFVDLLAALAARGHGYVSLTATDLLVALKHDEDGGRQFDALVQFIGTKDADLPSHLQVAREFLGRAWADGRADPVRRARATGSLLHAMLRHSGGIWGLVLAKLRVDVPDGLADYIDGWMRGHFIRSEDLAAAIDEAQKFAVTAAARRPTQPPSKRNGPSKRRRRGSKKR